MKRPGLFIAALLFLVVSGPARAEGSAAAGTGPWAGADEPTKAMFAACDAAIAEKHYLIAYNIAHDYADQNEYVLARQIEICIYWFGQSFMHQMFALVDLAPDQDLMAFRKKPDSGRYTMVIMDPVIVVNDYRKAKGDSGILEKVLGDYWHEVLNKYSGRWREKDEAIVAHMIVAYDAAFALGCRDATSLANYAEGKLRKDELEAAVLSFRESLAMDPGNGNAHYNLALALLKMGRALEALPEVEAAIPLYADDKDYLYDAWLMAADAYTLSKKYDVALAWLSKARGFNPKDYHVPLKELRVYAETKDFLAAAKSAEELLAYSPANAQVIEYVQEAYYAVDALEEYNGFLQAMTSKYETNKAALGNIHFHWAQLRHKLGDSAEALRLLDLSREYYAAVYSRTNKVFATIEGLKKAWSEAVTH